MDPTDRLRTADQRPSEAGEVVVHRDAGHVTPSRVAGLTPDVDGQLTSTLGW